MGILVYEKGNDSAKSGNGADQTNDGLTGDGERTQGRNKHKG